MVMCIYIEGFTIVRESFSPKKIDFLLRLTRRGKHIDNLVSWSFLSWENQTDLWQRNGA